MFSSRGIAPVCITKMTDAGSLSLCLHLPCSGVYPSIKTQGILSLTTLPVSRKETISLSLIVLSNELSKVHFCYLFQAK